MTGCQQMLIGSGGGVIPIISNINVDSNGSSVTASCTFNNDGSIAYAQTGGAAVGPPLWFVPQAAGVGNNYWIKCIVTSGSLSSNPAAAFVQLNVARLFTVTVVGAATKSASGTFQIASDAAGTNIVASGPWTMACN